MPHTGACLCGAVRFEIDGSLAPIQVCHCVQCRKAQGGPFATNIPVEAARLRFTAGADRLKAFEATPGKERVFCADCGSPVLSRRAAAPEVVRLRAGLVDEPVDARPDAHAHYDSRASWWEIAEDGLPRYPGPRPA